MSITRRRNGAPAFVMAMIGALAVLCGCGQSGPDRVLVHGKVTFDGAPPPADGTLVFLPTKPAKGQPTRPARAEFTQGDGAFHVTSVKPGDGLAPGTYRVEVMCWRQIPSDEVEGISHVPKSYSPPELKIKIDQAGSIEYNLEIPSEQ